MLQFVAIQTRPDTPTYKAISGQYTFVIALIDMKFHAGAKRIRGVPHDGVRIELGRFKLFSDACRACELFLWKDGQGLLYS
jgi:hypothetical protein